MRERQTPQAPPAPQDLARQEFEKQRLEYLAEEERILMLLEAHKNKHPAMAKATASVPQASSAASVDRSVPEITPAERIKATEDAKFTQMKMSVAANEGRERI